MENPSLSVTSAEAAALALGGLYGQYGYKKQKISKFEEYEFYLENKNFLDSDRLITFSDFQGRLMALRPDVTLSILKNIQDVSCLNRIFYDEHVYRAGKDAQEVREIPQTGLECIGPLDTCAVSEVISLALGSLGALSEEFVLDVSHMGILSGLLRELNLPQHRQDAVLRLIGQKNIHDLGQMAAGWGLAEAQRRRLTALTGLCGPWEAVLPALEALCSNGEMAAALACLRGLYTVLARDAGADRLRLDFSVVNDMHYYTGIVFQGFIGGVPATVLSGGQYDRLLEKFHKNAGAVGFAVYLDALEPYMRPERAYDVDVCLLYATSTPPAVVAAAAAALRARGQQVSVQCADYPAPVRARRTGTVTAEGGVDYA